MDSCYQQILQVTKNVVVNVNNLESSECALCVLFYKVWKHLFNQKHPPPTPSTLSSSSSSSSTLLVHYHSLNDATIWARNQVTYKSLIFICLCVKTICHTIALGISKRDTKTCSFQARNMDSNICSIYTYHTLKCLQKMTCS